MVSTIAEESLKRKPGGKYRWVILSLLFAATTINYIDRAVLGVLAPTLQEYFSWTAQDYGQDTMVAVTWFSPDVGVCYRQISN
jgi:hypothetical protein